MSDVNASDLTEINTADDVFDLYRGSGDQAKAGIEVEMAYLDPKSDDLAVMSLAQNRTLVDDVRAQISGNNWLHNEPTSELLEVASSAHRFANAKAVLDDTNTKIKTVSAQATKMGFRRSYFQELPERTADDLLSRIVDVERYKVMYAPYREDMKKCVQYFAVCKSNQVSVSYHDMDHMLENVRRLYMLAPFLFLLTDNSVGFSEGQPFAGNPAMTLRHEGLLEGRGGVLPYVFTAGSGEELVAEHINHVLNNPLFMYYDRAGTLTKVPSGDWSVTFNTLKERGLNIASNYYLAQSLLWPDVKIAALKNAQGGVYGHRYEARMFGVGVHQHQTAFIITTALAFHADFSAKVNVLLDKYGFSVDHLPQTYDLVRQSYKNARHHNGKFFDIAYGNGNMAEFACEFADLMEAILPEIGLEKEAQPLLGICRSGCTDGKVNRSLFPTLPDILNQQRNYDPAIFDNPNKAARDIYKKEMARINGGLCAAA